jgi:hypothetical protein
LSSLSSDTSPILERVLSVNDARAQSVQWFE